MAKKKATPSEIKPDPKNAREHGDENKRLIKASLENLGTGRSIVIDKEDYIVAGNGVYEQAKALGIPIKIIESTGEELVVIKRTDLEYNSEKRRSLAVADNATGELSDWNFEMLTDELIETWSIDDSDSLSNIGLEGGFALPDGEKVPFQQMTFTVANKQAEVIKSALIFAKQLPEFNSIESFSNKNSNGNALHLIVSQWVEQNK